MYAEGGSEQHYPDRQQVLLTSPTPPHDTPSGVQPRILAFSAGPDMARKRLQQKGNLYQQGGWWKLRWREDQLLGDGSIRYTWSKPAWIGPAVGRGKMTEKEARRTAWDNILSRIDRNMRTPQTVMTVREFVERKFKPEHVAMLKPGGRVHYSTHLPIVMDGIPEVKQRSKKKPKPGDPPTQPVKRVAGIGDMRLRDVSTEDCQRLTSAALQRGYSVQYATHIRNCISAIFSHAARKDWFSERNRHGRQRHIDRNRHRNASYGER